VHNDTDQAEPCAAAVVFEPGEDVDAAMAAAVAALRQAGLCVGGVLQVAGPPTGSGRRRTDLRVLASDALIRLDQPLGAGAQSCNLDGDALARAAQALREAVLARPDLLVVSRFGKQEARGGGMRAEIAEALLSGTPVLVAVSASLVLAWESFLGAPSPMLPVHAEAIAAWARAHTASRPAA